MSAVASGHMIYVIIFINGGRYYSNYIVGFYNYN